MWGLPMSRGRVASLEDWLVKAPPSYANHETQPKALSRHWIGQDLRAPEAYGGRGRRETDVRDGQPGTTIRAPNAGQLDAHPRPHRVSAHSLSLLFFYSNPYAPRCLSHTASSLTL